MSGLGTLPDPKDLRARLELRERIDPDPCPHPADALTYDGNWDMADPPVAQVTCSLCGHSPTIPIAERELARLNGGSRHDGHGSEGVMAPTKGASPHD